MIWKLKKFLETNKKNKMANHYFDNSVDNILKCFDFIITEKGFKLTNCEDLNSGVIVDYTNGIVRVHLYYDYRDNFFYFSFIKGINTQFPNDHDTENIKIFYDIIDKFSLPIEYKNLQPNDENYLTALELNAEILKKYADDILSGKEWF
jgi:hypothetical protein